jgi:type III secretion protein J
LQAGKEFNSMKKRLSQIIVLLLLVSLSACKVELYSDLQEKEANSIMAVLLEKGIQCSKESEKDTWSVLVDEEQISRSLEILKAEGLPTNQYTSVGEMFQKTGLVSSPTEDRIRFIYALSQDLAATIALIDGIVEARVHLVIPENDPFKNDMKPSSAAIFVKVRTGLDVDLIIPKIKLLALNSIEGLNYDKVSVVPFEAEDSTLQVTYDWVTLLGIPVMHDAEERFWLLIGGLGGVVVFLLCMLLYVLLLPKILQRKKEKSEEKA